MQCNVVDAMLLNQDAERMVAACQQRIAKKHTVEYR